MKMLHLLVALLLLSTPAFSQTGQIGSGTLVGNSSAARAPATQTTPSALIDRAISSTQGTMLYRNATVWTGLAPGTLGLPLLSGGAGANLAYGILGMSAGGTGANLTASNGGIFYSTGTVGAILSGTATARQMLQSGASTAPTWSTTTWPATTTLNSVLFSSAANVIGEATSVNGGVLYTSITGVPQFGQNPRVGGAGIGTGSYQIAGTTSGFATLTVLAAAGTPTITFGTNSGTPAVTATSPLSINTSTGDITISSVPLASLAVQATDTIVGNATAGSASPTALAIGSCSTSSSAVLWTTNTGFSCNTSINAATLGGATFAAPGAIGGGTPSTGAFTTITASTSLTSPLIIGGSGTTGTQLTLKTTTGVGTTDTFAFVGGSNGATTFATLNATGFAAGTQAPDNLLTANSNTGATVAPSFTSQIHLVGADATAMGIALDAYAQSPLMTVRRAAGTLASKTAVQAADVVFSQLAQAWDGSAYSTIANIRYAALNAQTGSDHSGQINFRTVPSGSTTISDAMILKSGLSTDTTDPGIGGLRFTGATIQFTALANAATTSAICYNTGTGLLTYNATVGTCTVSTLAAKNLKSRLTPKEGFDIVMAMDPWRYTLKEGRPTYKAGEQIGMIAEFAEKVEPRLVAMNDNGTPAGFLYEQYTAALTSGFKYRVEVEDARYRELRADNDNMRNDLNQLKKKVLR